MTTDNEFVKIKGWRLNNCDSNPVQDFIQECYTREPDINNTIQFIEIHNTDLALDGYARICGNVMDRDLNASKNLEAVAVSSTETLNACGELTSTQPEMVEQADSMNQEPNAIGDVLNG